ncbi:hypothetical protein T03_8445, partial [Trichinella britovi]
LQNAEAILLWSATITGVVFQDYEKFRRLCYLLESRHVISRQLVLCHLHSTEMTIVKTP